MSLQREIIKDLINRNVAVVETGLRITKTTVLDTNQKVAFVVIQKATRNGKTLTSSMDSNGIVGGEWVE